MKGVLEKISDLEKQSHEFEQKRSDLQDELLLTKRKINTDQKNFLASVLL